jgi:hypothetical protein
VDWPRPSSGTPTNVTSCCRTNLALAARVGLRRWEGQSNALWTIPGPAIIHPPDLAYFSKAFNTVDRRDIAEGLGQYARVLYRDGRWAYRCTSRLVLSSPNGGNTITSAQGVREGHHSCSRWEYAHCSLWYDGRHYHKDLRLKWKRNMACGI